MKIVISFGALYYVLYKIDFDNVLAIFKQIRYPYILIAVLFFVSSKMVAADRLNILFQTIGIKISRISNYKLYIMGMFYNLFLPGGIGGDGYKLYLLNRNMEVKGKRIFWTLLWDRLFGVIALVLLVIILSYFIQVNFKINYYQWIIIFVLPVGTFYLIKLVFDFLSSAAINAILLSVLVQSLQLASCFFILKAINSADASFSYAFLFLISSIIAALPISIGGMGAREITFLYGSELLQLDESVAVSISLLFYLITIFVSCWGIVYSFNVEKLLKPVKT